VTDSKSVFVTKIQAGPNGAIGEPERRKKDKPLTRQPINDYVHERRNRVQRKVAQHGGKRW
jgi:hypothetical protein